MEHQSWGGTFGTDDAVVIKQEPEDDMSDSEYGVKELDTSIINTTSINVNRRGGQTEIGRQLEDTPDVKMEYSYEGCEILEAVRYPEVKIEDESDSDCDKDSNLTRDHLPATTNIVQDSNLTRDHLPARTNIVQDSNLTRDHLPATTNIVQDSNLTRDHLPARTNIVQDDDELNQLTEVAGEMDCKDGIRNGNSNHLLVGRVIPTDVEGKDQEQLARDMEYNVDIKTEGRKQLC